MSLVHFVKYGISITNHNIDRVYKDYDLSKSVTFDIIRFCVSRVTKIDADVIDSKTRLREVAEARQLCHYFALYYGLGSLSRIGREYGNKDHATVLHSKKTVQNLKETNKEFFEKYDRIKQLIER